MKVMTILGTRPEIIRLSRVMQRLDEFVDHVIVHTGQNSDYELNDVFFRDLGVRQPDHFLSVTRESLGTMLGEVLAKSEAVIREEQPDAVLILGDTNSAFAAIIARRMKIPVYHMEAGNRCFDFNVPEELNRRIVDHISDFNLVYTEHARRNLLAEGIHPRRIYLTGSPMREVIEHNREAFLASEVCDRLGLEPQKYFLVSMHRAENVDIPEHLLGLLQTFERLHAEYELPIVVSTHPRTRQRLEALGDQELAGDIRFLPPFGYHEYVNLQINARCTFSDSGTISEESSLLSFPAVTMRNAMERPEAMDTGSIVLTGLDSEAILNAARLVTSETSPTRDRLIPEDYQIADTSHRVLRLILGTAKLSHRWDGIVAA